MAAGLAFGMGFIGYGAIFIVLLGGALIFFAEYFNYIEKIDLHTKEMIKKFSQENK